MLNTELCLAFHSSDCGEGMYGNENALTLSVIDKNSSPARLSLFANPQLHKSTPNYLGSSKMANISTTNTSGVPAPLSFASTVSATAAPPISAATAASPQLLTWHQAMAGFAAWRTNMLCDHFFAELSGQRPTTMSDRLDNVERWIQLVMDPP